MLLWIQCKYHLSLNCWFNEATKSLGEYNQSPEKSFAPKQAKVLHRKIFLNWINFMCIFLLVIVIVFVIYQNEFHNIAKGSFEEARNNDRQTDLIYIKKKR
jgi:ascorbate-specific PTS system EIIC-type component UlaA